MAKVIIAGGRDIFQFSLVRKAVEDSGFILDEVVCGMARGVDAIGKQIAIERGIPVWEFPANWVKYGKTAGALRYREMAAYGEALILVWDGKSTGSGNMLRLAKDFEMPIYKEII